MLALASGQQPLRHYGSETTPAPRICQATPISAQRTHKPWLRTCICSKGSGVYIPAQELEEHLRVSKNGKHLARLLMDSFWDRATLAASSASERSTKYTPLDSHKVATIACKRKLRQEYNHRQTESSYD